MSLYDPAVPTGTVQLDSDYINIRNNFSEADNSFGVDHYQFSDQTANNGFHNTVTTPLIVGAAHPATAANVPKFYGMQDTAPLGVIQYSRGGNNAVPSPVTYIQSQAAPISLLPGASTPILDFTGIARAIARVAAGSFTAPLNNAVVTKLIDITVWWNGTDFFINGGSTALRITNAGNILQVSNTTGATTFNDVYWTMEFLRIQV